MILTTPSSLLQWPQVNKSRDHSESELHFIVLMYVDLNIPKIEKRKKKKKKKNKATVEHL